MRRFLRKQRFYLRIVGHAEKICVFTRFKVKWNYLLVTVDMGNENANPYADLCDLPVKRTAVARAVLKSSISSEYSFLECFLFGGTLPARNY